MKYKVVYDISSAGFEDWWFSAFGLIFVVIGIFLVKNRKTIAPNQSRAFANVFSIFFLSFSVLWTALAFTVTFSDYLKLKKSALNNDCSFVEGTVRNFIPMPYEGHSDESFTVNGIRFHYSDYTVTSGFNNTKSHGGPIDEGVEVRIWHKGNDIIKLEVKK